MNARPEWQRRLEQPETVPPPDDLLLHLIEDIPDSEQLRSVSQAEKAEEEGPTSRSVDPSRLRWLIAAMFILASVPMFVLWQSTPHPGAARVDSIRFEPGPRAAQSDWNQQVGQQSDHEQNGNEHNGVREKTFQRRVPEPQTGPDVAPQAARKRSVEAAEAPDPGLFQEPLPVPRDTFPQDTFPRDRGAEGEVAGQRFDDARDPDDRSTRGNATAGSRSDSARRVDSEKIRAQALHDEISVTSESPRLESRALSAGKSSGRRREARRELADRYGDRLAPPEPDTMIFDRERPHRFSDPIDEPVSTFGLDVDTGSYTLARRYLLDVGTLPPPESIRVEEWVNYFDYGDRAPTRGDFGITVEGAPSPYSASSRRYLVRVGLRARDVMTRERSPVTLIFLVDVSGSMARENRLELVKRSLELLLDELHEDDRVGLVVYSTRARAILEPTSDRTRVMRAIARLQPENSTNLEAGMELAYAMAERNARRGVTSRVVLCSDGVANVGSTDPRELLESVAASAEAGIELATVGFGMGNYNDALMEQLADRGDGSYAYVDTLNEARRVFVENLTGMLHTVASDARVQVEFNPDAVVRYRQLGYENRELPPEAFRDPSTDAGEIGAGHAVSVLYEVELLRGASDRAKLAELRLRYRSKETGRFEEIEATIERKDLSASWNRAARGLELAAAVASVADRLRDIEGPDLRGLPESELEALEAVIEQARRDLDRLDDFGGERVEEFRDLLERIRRQVRLAGR